MLELTIFKGSVENCGYVSKQDNGVLRITDYVYVTNGTKVGWGISPGDEYDFKEDGSVWFRQDNSYPRALAPGSATATEHEMSEWEQIGVWS